ncbi:unnamed protein product [Lampetra fluviatilis]
MPRHARAKDAPSEAARAAHYACGHIVGAVLFMSGISGRNFENIYNGREFSRYALRGEKVACVVLQGGG